MCEAALSRMSSLTCIPGVPTLFQAPGWAKALPALGVHGLGHEELQDLPRPGCGSEGKRGPRRKAPGAGGGSREFQLAQGIEGPQGVWAAGVPWGHQHKDCLEGPERGEATPQLQMDRERRGGLEACGLRNGHCTWGLGTWTGVWDSERLPDAPWERYPTERKSAVLGSASLLSCPDL